MQWKGKAVTLRQMHDVWWLHRCIREQEDLCSSQVRWERQVPLGWQLWPMWQIHRRLQRQKDLHQARLQPLSGSRLTDSWRIQRWWSFAYSRKSSRPPIHHKRWYLLVMPSIYNTDWRQNVMWSRRMPRLGGLSQCWWWMPRLWWNFGIKAWGLETQIDWDGLDSLVNGSKDELDRCWFVEGEDRKGRLAEKVWRWKGPRWRIHEWEKHSRGATWRDQDKVGCCLKQLWRIGPTNDPVGATVE